MTDEVLRGLIEVHAMVGAAEACQLAEAVLAARASLARKDAFRDRLAAELENALSRNAGYEDALNRALSLLALERNDEAQSVLHDAVSGSQTSKGHQK